MSKKYHVEERVLLNKKAMARAFVVAVVEDTREISEDPRRDCPHAQIELRIADCIEEISFEFDLSSSEDRENSVFKARRLAEILCRFRDAVELEATEIEARQAVRPLLQAMTASA